MTVQIPDKFIYRDVDYHIISSAVRGWSTDEDKPFDPAMFDLKTKPTATVCRRSYIVTYSLINNHCVIADLKINLCEEGDQEYIRRDERPIFLKASPKATIKRGFQYLLKKLTCEMGMRPRQEAPTINGVEPIKLTRENDFFNYHYKGINYHLEFSGELLIANEPITYPKRGSYPPCKYKNVVELVFENGVLVGEFDRSDDQTYDFD